MTVAEPPKGLVPAKPTEPAKTTGPATYTIGTGRKGLIIKVAPHGVVTLPADRVELLLVKHAKALENRNAWHVPAGMLVTLVPTLVAATPKSALSLSADTWAALFIGATVIAATWFLALIGRLRSRAPKIDDLVAQMTKESAQLAPPAS